MKKSWLTILPLAFILLLVAMFMDRLATPRMSGTIDSPLVGKPVPPELGITEKPPYVINLFASWCTPCAIEHPYLLSMQKNGTKIIGIAYKDSTANVAKYLKLGGNPFSQVKYDENGDAGITLGITGVPESFAVDAAGIIRARQQGPFGDDASVKNFTEMLK